MPRKRIHDCYVCADQGFVAVEGEAQPCPRCNPDSGMESGEFEALMVDKHGRCNYAKGGGGRTCSRYAGHHGEHVFVCGK